MEEAIRLFTIKAFIFVQIDQSSAQMIGVLSMNLALKVIVPNSHKHYTSFFLLNHVFDDLLCIKVSMVRNMRRLLYSI